LKRRAITASFTALLCSVATGQTARTPDDALQMLVAGNRRFAADQGIAFPLGEGVRRSLRAGDHPLAIVVACSDSRVAPELVFNAALGELCVVRVAGNVCDPESLATIEHAAARSGAPLCVVVGHAGCGAVAAAVAGEPASPALGALHGRIDPAVQRARREGVQGEALLRKVEIENAYETVAECQRRSPLLRELMRLSRLRIMAAHYDLATGLVEWLPDRPVAAGEARALAIDVEAQGMPPHLALGMLQAGHRRFLRDARAPADLGAARRAQLQHGQRPFAVVIACADARIAPEYVFDAGLGDLFVIRVAGNVVSDEALASVEHAITRLGATLVVATGHRDCGAVSAAMQEQDDPQLSASMRALLARLEPSVVRARAEGLMGAALLERVGELNALRALAELRARSEVVRALEEQGRLGLVAAAYRIDTGDLRWLQGEPAVATAAPRPEVETAAVAQEVALEPRAFTPDTGALAHASPTPPPARAGRTPEPAPSSLVATLLLGLMVATSGVAMLVLWQRRRIARAAIAGRRGSDELS
jgi:carbonic anhydrase